MEKTEIEEEISPRLESVGKSPEKSSVLLTFLISHRFHLQMKGNEVGK